MSRIVPNGHATAHRVIPETRPVMLKADLRLSENGDVRAAVGGCIERASMSLGWNLDQLAQAVGKDARQVRRWLDGSENAQFSALLSVPALRSPLIIHLAMMCDDLAVRTVIEFRRTA